MTEAGDWNAVEYHRVSDPQVAWGRAVLARLELRGNERVIDAGCGTGRLTRELAARVPDGVVVGLDASRQMLEQARSCLAESSPPVRLVEASLPAVPIVDWADVIFSTATFHWVLDHQALFANLFQALRTHGVLHAQCGGAETAQRLKAAGFSNVQTGLEPAPVQFADEDAYRAFVATVIFRLHLLALPESLRPAFLDEVVDRAARSADGFTLDYVRLNLRGRRP